MRDATELILGSLAVVLGLAAFAIGFQVLREAWRGAFKLEQLGRAASRVRWRTGLHTQPPKPDAAPEAPPPPSPGRRER